jgi:hypothetical protein
MSHDLPRPSQRANRQNMVHCMIHWVGVTCDNGRAARPAQSESPAVTISSIDNVRRMVRSGWRRSTDCGPNSRGSSRLTLEAARGSSFVTPRGLGHSTPIALRCARSWSGRRRNRYRRPPTMLSEHRATMPEPARDDVYLWPAVPLCATVRTILFQITATKPAFAETRNKELRSTHYDLCYFRTRLHRGSLQPAHAPFDARLSESQQFEGPPVDPLISSLKPALRSALHVETTRRADTDGIRVSSA